jgi:hypothetical protein
MSRYIGKHPLTFEEESTSEDEEEDRNSTSDQDDDNVTDANPNIVSNIDLSMMFYSFGTSPRKTKPLGNYPFHVLCKHSNNNSLVVLYESQRRMRVGELGTLPMDQIGSYVNKRYLNKLERASNVMHQYPIDMPVITPTVLSVRTVNNSRDGDSIEAPFTIIGYIPNEQKEVVIVTDRSGRLIVVRFSSSNGTIDKHTELKTSIRNVNSQVVIEFPMVWVVRNDSADVFNIALYSRDLHTCDAIEPIQTITFDSPMVGNLTCSATLLSYCICIGTKQGNIYMISTKNGFTTAIPKITLISVNAGKEVVSMLSLVYAGESSLIVLFNDEIRIGQYNPVENINHRFRTLRSIKTIQSLNIEKESKMSINEDKTLITTISNRGTVKIFSNGTTLNLIFKYSLASSPFCTHGMDSIDVNEQFTFSAFQFVKMSRSGNPKSVGTHLRSKNESVEYILICTIHGDVVCFEPVLFL